MTYTVSSGTLNSSIPYHTNKPTPKRWVLVCWWWYILLELCTACSSGCHQHLHHFTDRMSFPSSTNSVRSAEGNFFTLVL